MKTINAAGGLVQNPQGEFLFIYRRGKWDLPKGKVDKGEAIEAAALREVREECGIENLRIVRLLKKTYHTYMLKNRIISKETYWYLMKTNWEKKPIPQTEEDITQAIWVDKNKMEELLEHTYENIREVVREFKN